MRASSRMEDILSRFSSSLRSGGGGNGRGEKCGKGKEGGEGEGEGEGEKSREWRAREGEETMAGEGEGLKNTLSISGQLYLPVTYICTPNLCSSTMLSWLEEGGTIRGCYRANFTGRMILNGQFHNPYDHKWIITLPHV